ncbi:hypothetical protein [Nitrogeniibacter aestuarii]|uniref:hypothetical protein n=1 Tax=Nitrogeniibacter aestuarii TaxID=2815343 RepID=UPI001E3902D2|nr:hypothetical protein [Nitrogeniibacter aestuarii]
MQINFYGLTFYLGLIGLSIWMLSRAWRIGKRNRLDLVANWSGKQLHDPERYKPLLVTVNLIGGIAALAIAALVLVVGLPFKIWASLAALIFWTYLFAYMFIGFSSKKAALLEEKEREAAKQAK